MTTTTATGRVLVVDDDLDMCHAIGEALTIAGIVTDLAFDGKHGLMLATLRDYAVIVTDLRMPELDGLAFARYVQDTTDPPLVVIVTAYPTWHAEDEIRRVGACEVWVKPLDLSTLVTRIRRLIGSKAADLASDHDPPG